MNLNKVLLIDDSDIDNMVNKKVIEKSGFTSHITVKKSAESAIEYLRELVISNVEDIPDMIFLDIRMPDVDGFGFLELYKNLPGDILAKSRIVMLSSSIDSEDYKRAMANPYVKHFLNKPLRKESVEMVAGMNDG